MDAATRLEPVETEPLTWGEICRRYPDQYVCLIDIATPARGNPEIVSARVVGHGETRSDAFAPIRDRGAQYPRFGVRFTGESTLPLIRPAFIFDDEDLEILRSRPAFTFDVEDL
jgi:hypothetical protein